MEGRSHAWCAVDVDPALVRYHQLTHDRQADARASGRPRARLVGTPEALEDVLKVLGLDTDTRVCDLEHGGASFACDPHAHRAAGLGVAQGVREQVGDDLHEPVGVANDNGRLQVPIERDVLVPKGGGHTIGLRGRHRSQVERALLEEHPGPLGGGEPVDVIQQPGESHGLRVHRLEVPTGVREHTVLRRLDPSDEPADRST